MSEQTVKPEGEAASVNWQRYANPVADKLLEQFATTSDFEQQKQAAAGLQKLYAENAPAIPLFPGPQWGEYNDTPFTGFPDENNPYALLSTYQFPDRLLVMTTVKPQQSS